MIMEAVVTANLSGAGVVRRDRTAIKRYDASRPVRLALADGLISAETSVFDYGCGHGDDLRYLKAFRLSTNESFFVDRPRTTTLT